MDTFIGIDLGTSACKLLLVSEDGEILASNTESYPVAYPKIGWSEQNPEDWFNAIERAIKRLLIGQDAKRVKGIGVGGQMHGLVALDKSGKPVRPCILWNDGRTEKETAFLNEVVGKDVLLKETANIAFAGFTAPKLLWLKENEPKNFDRIAKILLPKDYIVYRLCGEFSADFSDGSGTLLLDVKNKRWNEKICLLCGVKKEWLPALHESFDAVGKLLPSVGDSLGLSPQTVVCAGAGDNAAAAVGTGTVKDGDCNVSVGTSGTVFIPRNAFTPIGGELHNFCHASGGYSLMGCILSAAACNEWWMKNILNSCDYEAEQRGTEKDLGQNDVYFLPYLMGERSPHNDVNARGCFIGLRPDTTRRQMTLSVLEGVAFALKDCVNAAGTGTVSRSKLCGGGAKSKLWRQIIADVLGVPIEVPRVEEGPAYGGAILAMIACGKFDTVESAVSSLTGAREVVEPNKIVVAAYAQKYDNYRRLYPALKEAFAVQAKR